MQYCEREKTTDQFWKRIETCNSKLPMLNGWLRGENKNEMKGNISVAINIQKNALKNDNLP